MERDGLTDKQTNRQTEIWTDEQTDRQKDELEDRQIAGQKHKLTEGREIETHGQTDKQTLT